MLVCLFNGYFHPVITQDHFYFHHYILLYHNYSYFYYFMNTLYLNSFHLGNLE